MKRSITISLLICAAGASGCAGNADTDTAGTAAPPSTTTTDEPAPSTEAPTTEDDSGASTTSAPTTSGPSDGDGSTDTETDTATATAAQFPDNPDEYVAAWVEAWAQGDGPRAGELAADAPSTLVTCLGTTEGEWVLDGGLEDMGNFAGGEGLWWTTVRHEPTGAELQVYTDQGLYGAQDAVVGADLTADMRGEPQSTELPPIEDCYATEVLPALEAWGEGEAEPFTSWVEADSQDQLDQWQTRHAGTGARLVGLGSMERYGGDGASEDHRPTVSSYVTYDDGTDQESRLGTMIFQFAPEVLAETTDGSIYRVTYYIDRRFV